MAVSTTTFISDTVAFIRGDLRTNVTDPLSSRPSDSNFVMTSYPVRQAVYPIITVRYNGGGTQDRLGQQSELIAFKMPLEVRIWARNEKEKDDLTQKTINRLRSNQFGASSTSDVQGLHDFRIVSMTPIDEDIGNETAGRQVMRHMILNVEYLFILGS